MLEGETRRRLTLYFLVPGTGLEPARLAALDPKSSASANSAIPAICGYCNARLTRDIVALECASRLVAANRLAGSHAAQYCSEVARSGWVREFESKKKAESLSA